MAVSNPRRNIPCDYTPELPSHMLQKGDRRSAPVTPRENRRPINRKIKELLASRVV
jgi:hypothetical protein